MTRSYTAAVDIPAPPDAVWEVLSDFSSYAAWNPFTPGLRVGELGAPVVIDVDLGWAGVRRTREVLRELTPPSRLVWALELGIDPVLRARRTQQILPTPAGSRYETEDVIAGALTPVVDALFGGALTRGFEAMAQALAVEVIRRQQLRR